MAIHSIENEFLKISVNSKGAELCSIFDKKNDKFILWDGQKEFWGKHAPILFPAVGKLWNEEYRLNGKTFSMAKHGFARETDFQLFKITEKELIFLLPLTDQIKANYPFDFEFKMTFKLVGAKMVNFISVKNHSNDVMPFCIGGHPAFHCPLENMQLRFGSHETSDRLLLTPEGFLNGEKEVDYLNNTEIIPLKDELFKDDALIFDGVKSNTVYIENTTQTSSLKVEWQNFGQVAFWKPIGAPFICIEPWNGMCDPHEYKGEFSKKLGVINLEPNQAFEATISVESIR